MGEGFHLTPNRLQNRQQTRISSTLRDSKAAHPLVRIPKPPFFGKVQRYILGKLRGVWSVSEIASARRPYAAGIGLPPPPPQSPSQGYRIYFFR